LAPGGVVEIPGGYFRPEPLDLYRMYIQELRPNEDHSCFSGRR